jgi:hypothetical protein
LQNPHGIVQFSTDGIVSLEPLNLDIGKELGQWEIKRVLAGTPSVFLLSGVYTYRTEDDKRPTIKARGFKATEEWLLQDVPDAWRNAAADPRDESTWPTAVFNQKEFVTAGSAVAGRARFKTIGRWAQKPRVFGIHKPGLKRQPNELCPELYYGSPEQPARRCFELVETLPARNQIEGAFHVPSKPARPDWLETGEIALISEYAAEEDEETFQLFATM